MCFYSDLSFGNKYEEEFLKHADFDRYDKAEGVFKPYDLRLFKGNDEIKIEVKADRMMKKTKNVAIEYRCNNKDSGIRTTEAKYWAIFEVIDDETYNLYIIPTKVINEFIKERKYKKVVKGGYAGRVEMFIFDKCVFNDFLKK